jgi:ATP phosphoribosyltransferase regulatory subunit
MKDKEINSISYIFTSKQSAIRNMKDSLSKIPNGMRYYFGAAARSRRAIENAVMATFERRGFEEIVTPTVDYFALFARGMGEQEAARAFRFADADGHQLALRPDVTSSVARAAATLFAARPRPLRFCYAAPVFRRHPRSHVEWRREQTQLGCELIGANDSATDVEMLSIVAEILDELNLRAVCRMTINHVGVFNCIVEALKLNDDERASVRHLFDVRATRELENFLQTCASKNAPAVNDALTLAHSAQRAGGEMLAQAQEKITNERSKIALADLQKLWRKLEELDIADLCEVDFADVSGLDYYTGLVFKIYLEGAGAHVGSGGRYDNLAANFGRPEPAIGFVLELDSLTDVITARSK